MIFTKHMDVDDSVPFSFAHLVEYGIAQYTCIIHYNIELAEGLHGTGNRRGSSRAEWAVPRPLFDH